MMFTNGILSFTNNSIDCARDQKIYTTAGMQFVLECEGNGNYQMLQSRNGNFFCIDRDGFEVASDVEPESDCTEYMFI